MKIKIYHAAFEPEPELVAEIEVGGDTNDERLNEAYRLTQNLDLPWVDGASQLFGEAARHMGARSTSVGDVIETAEGLFMVAPFGFRKIESVDEAKRTPRNAEPQEPETRKTSKVCVICRNSNGEPDAVMFTVSCTEGEYDLGTHYDKAEERAEDQGYEGPYICFDEAETSPLLDIADKIRGVE